MPSEASKARHWRTRADPFADVWECEVVPLLRSDRESVLEAKTLLAHLQEKHPGEFGDGQVRTLQRRVREWRAMHGPPKEVFFEQEHEPGREAAVDFTDCNHLGVHVGGPPFPHLLFHFVLTFSGWTYVALAFGETFEALVAGVQGALWKLDGVPRVLRSDNLSAVLLTLLLLSLAGHMAAGLSLSNGQRVEHGQSEQLLVQYLSSGEFLFSLMENWESEFLQMGLYVLMTVRLRQYGSAESRPSDPEEENKKKESFPIEQQPWPMRHGGLWQKLYERWLSTTLLALFVLSFAAHFINSWRQPCRGATVAWCAAGAHGRLSVRGGVLVPVVAELAERIHGGPGAGPAIDRAEAEGFAQSKQVEAPNSHTGH